MSSFNSDEMFDIYETNQQAADATKEATDTVIELLKANKVDVCTYYVTYVNGRAILCEGMMFHLARYSDGKTHRISIWVKLSDKRRRTKCNRVIKQLRLIGFTVMLSDCPMGPTEYF